MSKTPTLVNVETLTNQKYLNLQRLTYDNGCQWVRATRDTEADPAENLTPTAVQVLVQAVDGRYLFIREFRYSLNKWIVGTVAGLIENGEDVVTSARRELKEEAGLDVPAELFQFVGCYLGSAGLSDELTAVVVVDLVEETNTYQVGQSLDGEEIVEVLWEHPENIDPTQQLVSASAFVLLAA